MVFLHERDLLIIQICNDLWIFLSWIVTLILFSLQSDVPIDLLDVDKNSAVVSFSECDSEVRYPSTESIQILQVNALDSSRH